ncbi:MAG: 3'-5' exonuclease, partial [Bacteroidota bacterium]
GKPMFEVLAQAELPARTRNAIDGFVAMIGEFSKKAQSANAAETAVFIARRSGLMDELKHDTTVEGIQRLDNVQGLLDGIQAFVDNDVVEASHLTADAHREDGGDEFVFPIIDTGDKSLASYLQQIALVTDLDETAEGGDYVTLMSVHSAKGLEFKSIFLTGLEEQLFPSFMAMETPEGLDEERRLFYVAITRAEQFLTLSYANSRYRYGQERFNSPSRFLEEINMTHLDATAPIGAAGFGSGRLGQGVPASQKQVKPAPATSGVSGNFARRGQQQEVVRVDPATFKPSSPEQIQAGMKVLHLRFGEGKVTAVDGSRDNRVATIYFEALDVEQQKRIALKFAKLQIVE